MFNLVIINIILIDFGGQWWSGRCILVVCLIVKSIYVERSFTVRPFDLSVAVDLYQTCWINISTDI